MSKRTITLAAAAALALLGLVGPAQALGVPVLGLVSSHQLSSVAAGTYAKYELTVSNAGMTNTTAPVSVDFEVPAGLQVTAVSDEVKEQLKSTSAWSCAIAGDSRSVSCAGPDVFGPLPVEAGKEACEGAFGGEIHSCRIYVTLKAEDSATPGTFEPTIEACGGGAAACAAASDPIEVSGPPAFGLRSFDGRVLKTNGSPATQAGSHPDIAETEFFLDSSVNSKGVEWPVEQLQDVVVRVPPGLVGNTNGIPTCTQVQLLAESGDPDAVACPPASQVGFITVWLSGGKEATEPGEYGRLPVGVYNMERPAGTKGSPIGTPALFAFNIAGQVIQVYAKLRTGDDYGVTVISKNAPQTLPIAGVKFEFWGVPADPSHDAQRGECGKTAAIDTCPSPEKDNPKPFLSLPTSCEGPGPNNSVETFLEVTSWEEGTDGSSFLSHDNEGNPIGTEGCNALDFSPSLKARPTTNVADSPSGLDVDLHIPQSEDPKGTAEAHLRDTTVTLPEGLVINPSGANGLDGCSLSEFGFTGKEGDVIHTTPDAATCPDASKLGTVEVESPLLDHPMKGSVHIADPYQNPFNSLLALYITLDDPATGIVVKLAGEVHADPDTGQLATTVLHNPQLPFEDFRLHFFGGAGGSLRTPATCGEYATSSDLVPWTAPEGGSAIAADTWAISQAPGGGACPTAQGGRPNSPDLDAGTISPIAAAYSPFVLNLRRADGTQNFAAVTITPPPGFTGKLAGIPACSDASLAAAAAKAGRAEEAAPSCPAAARLGTVSAAAGAGPAPYHAKGTAYLAGPYKGAPLSMAIITPATAGPFDLGTIVVRVALQVNRETGQITASSDPIPQILAGIPLDIRSVQVNLDRSQFARNGTSCDPLAFSGQLLTTLGQVAPLTERFQLGECGRLAFKPKLGIRLIGGTRRGAHPALKATLTMPPGVANIASAVVTLPHSEFLDQAHIGTVCTRVQFAADQCPAASIYGHAVAISPLVDYAVQGPVYLRSSSHELPDLVIALKGPPSQPVEVDAVARVDSVKGDIRSSFEGVPDLPLSTVTLEMEGGRKGLLQNSTNICKGKHLVTAEFEAQNAKVADLKPPLKAKCAKPRKKSKQSNHRAQKRG